MDQRAHTVGRHRDAIGHLGSVLGFVSGIVIGWLYVRPPTRGLTDNLLAYGLKILGAAFSPILVLAGLLGALISRRPQRRMASVAGGVGAWLGIRFIKRVTAPHDGFQRAFGPNWEGALQRRLAASQNGPPLVSSSEASLVALSQPFTARSPWLRRRWRVGQVAVHPKPQMIRDVAFATVPGVERALLCDLWIPAAAVRRSGVGVIYLHGGAWQAFDKDVMTRPFFRHLTVHGHVVMDVAYRLARETDMAGMLGDVKRAIFWMKAHSGRLGIDPDRIVLVGGSAGGHLALLAGYTPNDPELDPPDVRDMDTSVRGVVAYYPVADLRTLTYYWSEQAMHPLATALGRVLGYFPREGYLPWSKLARRLFGKPLDEVGNALLLFSPVAHVGPHCPPTLILQGLHDHIVPVADVQALHAALVKAGRPAILVELPQVEHAFDMIGLQVSPPAQAALYDVERFLALVA